MLFYYAYYFKYICIGALLVSLLVSVFTMYAYSINSQRTAEDPEKEIIIPLRLWSYFLLGRFYCRRYSLYSCSGYYFMASSLSSLSQFCFLFRGRGLNQPCWKERWPELGRHYWMQTQYWSGWCYDRGQMSPGQPENTLIRIYADEFFKCNW